MTAPRDPRQWAAVRALCEGAPPTYTLVAAASQIRPDTIKKRAALEGWAKRNFQNPKAREAWMRRTRPAPATVGAEAGNGPGGPADAAPEQLRNFINSQIREIMARSADGVLDKADADTLLALLRMAEKSAVFERAADPTFDEPTDEEIAEVLQRIMSESSNLPENLPGNSRIAFLKRSFRKIALREAEREWWRLARAKQYPALTPKDMDFVEAKNSASRDIALAFGVPPMLLGIPGDNTYANYQEANRAFYRLTVLPLVARTAKEFSAWLGPVFGEGIRLWFDADQVEGLAAERDALWARVGAAGFLTDDEKREAVGYGRRE